MVTVPQIAARAQCNTPLRLQLDAGTEPADLADNLHWLSVIYIQYDSFTGGCPYSQARFLREWYGYRAEQRVRGNFLPGQFNLMQRCGIDTL